MRKDSKNYRYGPVNISASMRVAPYLLQMKWNGHPLHYHSRLGWGYIIDPTTDNVTTNEMYEIKARAVKIGNRQEGKT